MSEQDSGEKEGSFQEFTSQALRLHRKGSFETLLAQHLVVATPSDPMVKTRLVCEAAYMVPQGKLSIDMQQVERIYMVTLSLLNTNIFKFDSVHIAWGFEQTEENYQRFIAPWHRDIPLSFVYGTMAEAQSKREVLKQAETEAEEFFLYTVDLDLSIGSFQMLKTEFLRWTIPLVMQVFEQLSKLVDPDLYKQMLQIMKGEITQK